MSFDITHAIEGWDFVCHELNVRMIDGNDGRRKIQMRIDLGLLQMEVDGRPDGLKPNQCESLLEYYRREAAEYGNGYRLASEAADELFREGWQYYQRYLCLFHLGDFEKVIRDTERNLDLFRFVCKHLRRKRDRWRFDQHRAYVIMMNTRARAMMYLEKDDRPQAVTTIRDGCARIKEFLCEYSQSTGSGECFELDFLRRWNEDLDRPAESTEAEAPEACSIEELQMHLRKAVEREDYESAAFLRDQIKHLEQSDSALDDPPKDP